MNLYCKLLGNGAIRMNQFYTAVMTISNAALVVLSILVIENGRLSAAAKKKFILTYLVIVIASLAEWGAVVLDGAPECTRPLHVLTKCLDYCLTPFAGVLFIRQITKQSKWHNLLWGALLFNVLFEIVSAFTGWAYYVDADNYYHHGAYHIVYTMVFIFAIIMVLVEFRMYGSRFQKQNTVSLYAIVALVCISTAIQEIVSSNLRVTYLSLTLASTLLYVHYSAYDQQDIESDLSRQKELLETDSLTGLYSRYSYTETLNDLNFCATLPDDLVVFAIDINGLKAANDNLGHEAGDELIRGAAECIAATLGKYGKCFRTGGDEFIAILHVDPADAESVMFNLNDAAEQWSGRRVKKLSMSVGYAAAAEHPNLSLEKIIHMADQMMYYDKSVYYSHPGRDRRRR